MIRKLRTLLFVISLSLPALLLGASVASADDTICRGTIGAVTVDNLVVPDNARCTLQGTRVEGNIFVETNSVLVARDVRVDGNIQADGHRLVFVYGSSTVGGNVQIEQGAAAWIDNVRIDGDLQVEQNNAQNRLTRNVVGGNLQANQNSGGLLIALNRIAENLQCQANNPPPTGGRNVAGDKEDQCANL
jgi:hypothetical protein